MALDIRALASARPLIVRLLAGYGVPARDRDDVAQAVMLSAWSSAKRGRYRPTGANALERWLYGLSWRWASSYRRAAWVRRERLDYSEHLWAAEDERPLADASIEDGERGDMLLGLVMRLPPSLRDVLVAHEIDGLEMTHVALLLGQRLSTCWGRHRAAMAALAATARRTAVKDLHSRHRALHSTGARTR